MMAVMKQIIEGLTALDMGGERLVSLALKYRSVERRGVAVRGDISQ